VYKPPRIPFLAALSSRSILIFWHNEEKSERDRAVCGTNLNAIVSELEGPKDHQAFLLQMIQANTSQKQAGAGHEVTRGNVALPKPLRGPKYGV
jgi:hypothetical protein